MNTITHKQAQHLIDRRLDGMLKENQQMLLDGHLQACDSCRAYSNEMDLLPSRLKHEFQAHWNKKPGLSQEIIESIAAKARRIPMANRLFSNLRLLTGIVVLVGLALVINFVTSRLQSISPVEIESTRVLQPNNALIAFVSTQNGNSEIYTIHTDGSGLTNITNNPAHDSNPFWSPDGKRIAFESDRNGTQGVYLVNADGSNLVPLSNNEIGQLLPLNTDGRSNPWSPDGNELLYIQQKPEDETIWLLYSIDLNTKAKILLASGRIQSSNLSWSPNGDLIGYMTNDSTTPDESFVPGIHIAKADGTFSFATKELLHPKEVLNYPFYYWSRNGQSIFFTTYKHIDEGQDQWIAYELSIPKRTLIEKASSSTRMQDWWNGTSFIVGNGAGSPLTWLRSDKTYSSLKPLENCEIADPNAELHYGIFPKRSSNGDQIIAVTCPNNDLLFYYTSSAGTRIKQLFKFHAPSDKENRIANIIWSPDSKFIAFKTNSSEGNNMYILNVSEALNNPSIQPLQIPLDESLMPYEPSWQPVP